MYLCCLYLGHRPGLSGGCRSCHLKTSAQEPRRGGPSEGCGARAPSPGACPCPILLARRLGIAGPAIRGFSVCPTGENKGGVDSSQACSKCNPPPPPTPRPPQVGWARKGPAGWRGSNQGGLSAVTRPGHWSTLGNNQPRGRGRRPRCPSNCQNCEPTGGLANITTLCLTPGERQQLVAARAVYGMLPSRRASYEYGRGLPLRNSK